MIDSHEIVDVLKALAQRRHANLDARSQDTTLLLDVRLARLEIMLG
jgi:hypothetical protein